MNDRTETREMPGDHRAVPPGERIAYVLNEVENGAAVAHVCRQVGISEATFYLWKRTYAHLGISSLRRLQQLEEENRRLRKLVAELTGDTLTLGEAGRRRD